LSKASAADYSRHATERCERVLVTVLVEFLCETDAVVAGRIFKPNQDYGSTMAALNVAGAELARRDYVEAALEAERLDDGGRSRVTVRVANLLPLAVLKITAFQDRPGRSWTLNPRTSCAGADPHTTSGRRERPSISSSGLGAATPAWLHDVACRASPE
jgi:hypothetical protein